MRAKYGKQSNKKHRKIAKTKDEIWHAITNEKFLDNVMDFMIQLTFDSQNNNQSMSIKIMTIVLI